ncbi:MAG: hypothetical protein JJW03_05260 [Desulfosarcina sp.]|nr:hypothetical protein [Desulfobacterales bacterium]
MKYLFLILLFISTNCFAANIYVDKTLGANCTTGNYSITNRACDGSDGNAYQTVAGAIAAMSGGDDIYLRGGTYYEHDIYIAESKSGTSENWSSMQSYPGEWAIIDGQRQCTNTNIPSIICNGYFASYDSTTYAKYWKFERLEITGGGDSSSEVNVMASGIHWNKGPITIRYCYVHDNLANNPNENPGGITGCSTHDAIVEYNYLKNNGAVDLDAEENSRNICFFGSSYSETTDTDWYVHNNEIRYNLIETGGASGISMKANQDLTTTRDGSDTSRNTWGDKIHHNIVLDSNIYGIQWSQDYCQIYNNIVQHGDLAGEESAGILVTSFRLGCYNTLDSVVYNNTVIDTHSAAIFNEYVYDAGEGDIEPAIWWVYNNIIDNHTHDWDREDITFGSNSAAAIVLTDIYVDRNLFYRCDANEDSITMGPSDWTIAEFISASGKSEEMWKHAYNAGDLLYQATSGADQYKIETAYTLGTGNVTNKGKGGTHPYLSGVTIPSYIGAVNPNGVDSGLDWDPDSPNPDDAGWVDYVLNLANALGNHNRATISSTGNAKATFSPTGNVTMEIQ